MRLEFTPNAEVDIDEATLWYFEQEPELAARFVIELERVLDQILENPNAWTVAMITHQHRDPAHWRHRG